MNAITPLLRALPRAETASEGMRRKKVFILAPTIGQLFARELYAHDRAVRDAMLSRMIPMFRSPH